MMSNVCKYAYFHPESDDVPAVGTAHCRCGAYPLPACQRCLDENQQAIKAGSIECDECGDC